METLKFKTNINCGGCIEKVTPALNKEEKIKSWQVDTINPNKILIVKGIGINAEYVKQVLENVGYKAEEMS